jgi:hypothetical protein
MIGVSTIKHPTCSTGGVGLQEQIKPWLQQLLKLLIAFFLLNK